MGRKRGYDFDSFIGVGGKKPWKRDEGIALKINWIGLDPEEVGYYKRGPRLGFKHFYFKEEKGPELKKLAPKFFNYLFGKKVRGPVTSQKLPDNMQKEIAEILRLAEKSPKSKGLSSRKASRGKC